jgi:threonine aldolase
MSFNDWIDIRSDTVTQPCKNMRKVMAEAEVGDAVYGDDKSVNQLQELGAELTGQQASLYVSSGVQSNLIALLVHCARGDEYIVGQDSHTYKYEGGGAAVLGSIQPQPIEISKDGTLNLMKVASVIKEDDFHFARSKLLSLENTIGGKVLPKAYLDEAVTFCKKHQLKIHMDGARIANAAVAQNSTISNLVSNFDSVSICLSKGLGAPVGSLLCASQEFIKEARHWQKMLGGGMRQAGIIASAGIYALKNNINRLELDHENATKLSTGLNQIESISVLYVSTNIIMLSLPEDKIEGFKAFLISKKIKASVSTKMRIVTHLNISEKDVIYIVDVFKQFFQS